MDYKVYILYSEQKDKFYIGQTRSLSIRLTEHLCGYSLYTRQCDDWDIVYVELFKSRGDVVKREKFLKKQKNKEFYRSLILSLDG